MKIQFIAPSWAPRLKPGERRRTLFPPLNLAVLAGLTPGDWEASVVDESVQNLDVDDSVDIVAITAMTAVAPRAYQIADEYRKRGVTVVMGGIHPTALPEEAGAHADAVVIGEAEPVWHVLLEDFKGGRLKKYYRCGDYPPLENLPLPRRDLFDPGLYLLVNSIQTSRGCPHNCSFCSVTRFFGRTYRTRPIEDIVKEIESLEGRNIIFVDDNIIGNPNRAKRLFEAIRPYGLRWMGQSPITIAKNEELLSIAARSGCAGLFVGFESLLADNLRQVAKNIVNRAEGFMESIKRIHSYGIGIEGAFIFGFDEDDPGVFKRTVEFARKAKLALAQFGILTPFPGTLLQRQLEETGRIVVRDWSKYTISNAVFQPVKMTREKLQDGFNWAYREFYSYRSIFYRLAPRLRHNFPLFLGMNMSFRNITTRSLAGRTIAAP